MSAEASSWALKQDAGGPGPKLLLLVLANHAGKEGVTFAGRALLAQECNCRPETTTANFRKLEDDGLIRRVERRRENGSKTTPWIILAPEHEDRGPMVDGSKDELPEAVFIAATEMSGEVLPPVQVGNSGGPEQSEEQSVNRPSSLGKPDELNEDGAQLLRAKTKVAGRLVTTLEMMTAIAVVRAFNECSGSRFGVGAHLTPIVGRARERPSWSTEQHVELVRSAFRLRWWERNGRKGRRPTPAVVYGNEKVFEHVVQDAEDERAGRAPESAGRPALRKASDPWKEEM